MFKRSVTIMLLTSLVILLNSCANKEKVIYVYFNNDTEAKTIKIKNHNEINDIDIPEKEGYIFAGLYLDSQYKIKYSNKISIKEIESLYVKWDKLQLTDEELFLFTYQKALTNHLNAKSYTVNTTGKALTGIVDQGIYNIRIKEENYLYFYSASLGLAKAYVLLEYENNIYTLKKGKPDNDFMPKSVSYEENITLQNYIDEFGVDPYNLNYIINEKNLLDVFDVIEDKDKYIFKLKLYDSAAINYKKYIIGVNVLESKNVMFEQIEITFVITKDYYFSKIIYNENYTIDVKIPILGYSNQAVKALITETFDYH